MSLHNRGSSDLNVTTLQGSLNSVQNFAMYFQNFTEQVRLGSTRRLLLNLIPDKTVVSVETVIFVDIVLLGMSAGVHDCAHLCGHIPLACLALEALCVGVAAPGPLPGGPSAEGRPCAVSELLAAARPQPAASGVSGAPCRLKVCQAFMSNIFVQALSHHRRSGSGYALVGSPYALTLCCVMGCYVKARNTLITPRFHSI